MDNNGKHSRIVEFDIIRVIAMFWVITYHFGCEYQKAMHPVLNFFYTTPNFDFGNVAVTLFLCLSGALLYRKYRDSGIGNLGHFYASRVRVIYPPFWILNIYVIFTMVRHAIAGGSPFFAGNPLKLLLTLAGFDGYVSMFGFDNYFFCGEWFIGAIVFLYLVFPVLLNFYKKSPRVMLAILALCYALQYTLPSSFGNVGIESVFSILPCTLLLKFTLGFALMDMLPHFKSPKFGFPALALAIALLFVNIPGALNFDCLGSIEAILIFAVIAWCGGTFIKSEQTSKAVTFLASVSYCVFLIQHVAIVWLQMLFTKVLDRMGIFFSTGIDFALLVITAIITIIAAWCLKKISDWVTQHRPFSILPK